MARSSGVAAILLAAGGGSRFGGGKLFAGFRGKPLVCHALETIRRSPVEEAFVVVGDRAGEIRELCEPYGFTIVENPEWEEGQSTSVLAGLKALEDDFDAVVVLLADQPLVGAGVVERLVAAFEGGAKIAVATYCEKRRNPVLFSREAWVALEEELEGDEGARRVIRAHPELVSEVPCDGLGDPFDVDTKEDLGRLER
ncbi:MAG: nucleotidyltransferase family protein [Rubrobacteraceae bacterium]